MCRGISCPLSASERKASDCNMRTPGQRESLRLLGRSQAPCAPWEQPAMPVLTARWGMSDERRYFGVVVGSTPPALPVQACAGGSGTGRFCPLQRYMMGFLFSLSFPTSPLLHEFYKSISTAVKGTSSVSECPFVWCSMEESRSLPSPSRNGQETASTAPLAGCCCRRMFWGDEVKLTAPQQAASWEPGIWGARAVNLQAGRDPFQSCKPPMRLRVVQG